MGSIPVKYFKLASKIELHLMKKFVSRFDRRDRVKVDRIRPVRRKDIRNYMCKANGSKIIEERAAQLNAYYIDDVLSSSLKLLMSISNFK